MNIEELTEYCQSLKFVTTEILWGDVLVFKVGGKMFCFAPRKYLSLNAVYKYKSAVRIKSLFCADNERFTLLIQNKIKYPAIKKQHKYGQKSRWEDVLFCSDG